MSNFLPSLVLLGYILILINGSNDFSKYYNVANYVLRELRKLSDSGIYDTLELSRILFVESHDGVYHYNTAMTLELSSPYFLSGNTTENFNVVLMENKNDNIKSFAIDEFPRMKTEKIEEYSIHKIEKKKIQREENFRRLEIKALLLGENPSYVSEEYIQLNKIIESKPVPELLKELDDDDIRMIRYKNSQIRQQRITHPQILIEEKLLQSHSLAQLYQITIHHQIEDISDYQYERAKELIDLSMSYLQQQLYPHHSS